MEVSQLAFNPRLAGAIPISNIGSTSHGGPFDLAPGSLTVVVSEETDSATLGRVKLGLAAAMFFTVLVACCLPILLLFCLQRKTTRRKGLGHSRPSEALREKPSDSVCAAGSGTAEEGYGGTSVAVARAKDDDDNDVDDEEDDDDDDDDDDGEEEEEVGKEDRHIVGGVANYNRIHTASSARVAEDELLEAKETSFLPEDHRTEVEKAAAKPHLPNSRSGSLAGLANSVALGHGQASARRAVLRHRRRLVKLWASRINCFAAGLFLSTAFMDLLPDVNEAMDQAMNEMKFETEFPLSSFISLVGFFLVLSVEQVVLSHRESRSTNQTARVQNIAQLSDQAVESKWRALLRRSARLPSSQAPVDRDGPARLSLPGGTFRSVFRPTRGNSLMSRRGLIEDEATSQTTTPPAQTQDRQRPFFPPSPEPVSPQANGSLDRNPSQAYNPFRQSDATGYISPANFSDDRQHTFSFFHDHPTYDDDHHQHLHHLHHDPEHYHHHRHHHHQHGHNANPEVANSPVFRVVLLLVAMSLHAVFEGLAVGLQDSVQHTITLFSALALHKLIMAIGIGVNLATVHSHPGHSSTGPHANSETRRHSHIAEFESRPSELGLPSGGERHSSEAPLLDQPRGDDETGEAKSSHNVFPSWPGPHGDRSVGPSQSTSRGSAKKRSLHDLRMKGLACLVFASASPIGVLVGWGLMQQHQSPGLLLSTAVLQGLACGTFFYVVFCELLPGEFHGGAGSIHHDRLPKLSFLMFGFLLIAVYLYFQPG